MYIYNKERIKMLSLRISRKKDADWIFKDNLTEWVTFKQRQGGHYVKSKQESSLWASESSNPPRQELLRVLSHCKGTVLPVSSGSLPTALCGRHPDAHPHCLPEVDAQSGFMPARTEVIFWFEFGPCVGRLVAYGSDCPWSIPQHMSQGVGG